MKIDSQAELKANVETLATERDKTPLDIITELQIAAAQTKNETLLDALGELKWTYIELLTS